MILATKLILRKIRMYSNLNILISGGGTGGHVFPAISIANALKVKDENINILFVGADHKMEMQRVPAAGYPIIGLPVRGFQRKISHKTIVFLYHLLVSMVKAHRIINNFKPHVVVGVGGYASGPVLKVASLKGIPLLIQEQNSYAGVTNRLLAGKAEKICVAYEGMEKYFPAGKIILTGNPVRNDLIGVSAKHKEAADFFGIPEGKKVILVLGGSLGAGSINESISASLEMINESGIEFIWQTGATGYRDASKLIRETGYGSIHAYEFISRMDLAYAIADLVISRAGAGTISELAVTGKASILVPSPNVAEDHQARNAVSLAKRDATVIVDDVDCPGELVPAALKLVQNTVKLDMLKKNISLMALPDSAQRIADEIIKLATDGNRGR
jgi:UDP-N-acetylglucosamine--N-acetylmuramyl-(pentapeptide) pyrophosphoryl-undecaprenol N-acetylglucosamine transferase